MSITSLKAGEVQLIFFICFRFLKCLIYKYISFFYMLGKFNCLDFGLVVNAAKSDWHMSCIFYNLCFENDIHVYLHNVLQRFQEKRMLQWLWSNFPDWLLWMIASGNILFIFALTVDQRQSCNENAWLVKFLTMHQVIKIKTDFNRFFLVKCNGRAC